MSEVEGLLANYSRFVRLPWDRSLAGPQKVWFALHDPAQERRLRLRLEEFRLATLAAGHGWVPFDLTDAFARWMAHQEYRDAYFAEPELLTDRLGEFLDALVAEVEAVLTGPEADDAAVVAVTGLAALFGLTRGSALIERVAPRVCGRLLVFFPGHHEGSNYRLLDARDGWNYLAIPITASDGK